MKRIFSLLILGLTLLTARAEQRIYFVRSGELPTDAECIDLRPQHSDAQWALRNIYPSSSARYALFEKRADSWWQVTTEIPARKAVDLSMVTSDYTLCLKVRRTVDYPLTLTLGRETTAEGYKLTTTVLPADGEFHVLTIPLSKFSSASMFASAEEGDAASYSGTLFRLHSDLGYTGDEVGIDYCYLTTDPTVLDEGSVLPEQRYYMVTNAATVLTDTPYELLNLTPDILVRSAGWQQWSYISFPYYSCEEASPVAIQLTTEKPLELKTSLSPLDLCLLAQVRTSLADSLSVAFYHDGICYRFEIDGSALTTDNKTWNRLYLPLDEAQRYTYSEPTSVVFSLKANASSEGVFSVASLVLTNNHSAVEPQPIVPNDPRNEQRIYLLNDGSPLPTEMTCTDYRLDHTSYLSASYNNCSRSSATSYLTLTPSNGWWSTDLSAKQSVDLSKVDETWTLHTRIRTTSSYRPINMIFYRTANSELKRYPLSDTQLPKAKNDQWIALDIPMKDILPASTTLATYAASHRVFSFHSDNGGTAGVEVSMEYLYFSHAGESMPDPTPGIDPEAEPELTPITPEPEAIPETLAPAAPKKILLRGQILILREGAYYDVMGNKTEAIYR